MMMHSHPNHRFAPCVAGGVVRLGRVLGALLILLVPFGCETAERAERVEVQAPFPPRDVVADESKIKAPLLQYLETARDDEFVSVVAILERQLTEEEKISLFSQIKTDDRVERKQEQRRLLIAELKRLARADQRRLVGFLRSLEKEQQVRKVQPLWLSNVVGVQAPKSVIELLTTFNEIKSIHLEIPRPVKGATPWGVMQINADDVWNLTPTGYDGSGVTVAILDTGVDYAHSDLVKRMWINTPEDIDGDGEFTPADNNNKDDDGNGYVDDVVGWNFAEGNNNPADIAYHGTHVAGTVAGDGSGGTSTGVAPGARIMALREAHDNALSTQVQCWNGMQYALANGADIISFSSGWLDIWNPNYKTWRDVIHKLMDAGVLVVTIVGDDSSATVVPNNVTTPGRVPLALTVGATDNADTIAGFSSTGPVTWQTVKPFYDYPWPPGLLKPDVSAPGVLVSSTKQGGGYVSSSGTSMAAPHVAGVAALLLDKDPGLNPYELKYIIEETALDLGAAGPDPTYGWGRVDALSAINHTISPAPYDLSITGTSDLYTTVDIWIDNNDDGTPDKPMALTNNHLYARARNLGGQVVTNVELKFYYLDLSTATNGDLDPNGDGDPSDGDFTYIGSYRVPTMGPKGSDHDTAVGLVNWNVPTPVGPEWCVGVGIVAPSPPNSAELDTSNNIAYSNFVAITTSSAGIEFRIVPPPDASTKPFGLEIRTENLPKEARVELVVGKELEERLLTQVKGLEKIEEPLLTLKRNLLVPKYFKVLESMLPNVRYALVGERGVLSNIVSPKGEPYLARLVVHVPDKAQARENMLVVVSTLNQEGEPVGGLTLNVVKGTHHQKGGPYPPRDGQ